MGGTPIQLSLVGAVFLHLEPPNIFSEDAVYFDLFGVKEGSVGQAADDRKARPPPAPAAKHEYPNWEDAFSHRDFALENESIDDSARGGFSKRSRSPSPIKRAEKQPTSKIDQYADAFEQFERGKLLMEKIEMLQQVGPELIKSWTYFLPCWGTNYVLRRSGKR